jgi:hypothetical protein
MMLIWVGNFCVPFVFGFGGTVKLIKRSIWDRTGTGTGIDIGFKAKTDLAVIFDWEDLGNLILASIFKILEELISLGIHQVR